LKDLNRIEHMFKPHSCQFIVEVALALKYVQTTDQVPSAFSRKYVKIFFITEYTRMLKK